MREPAPKAIRLQDYRPPEFLIDNIALDVDIRAEDALVSAALEMRRNPQAADRSAPLVLDGDELELVAVSVNGTHLRDSEYQLEESRLTIPHVPERFTLKTVTTVVPQKNTKLEGLYASKIGFVTQCEAQGFRRITWFLDRPDVMARYTTTIHADKAAHPVLLSNGNLLDSGDESAGRHWATFEDPFPKPSYLFAMVAAKLEVLEDAFTTRSGRHAKLFVYVEPGRLEQASWAMECLKRAMKWDEERFGLELDLDQYKIVAVGDFNSGAMENKGLNIFNTKYVLARPDIATDLDYMNIDRVVAHEYLHNWTGDRVTCRDWFQLSLKEGLTVFRDQEYGADTYSRAVQRIAEVRTLRAAQFPEDAGPMKHPVRPQSYVEIRNFYTVTVYEKGSEVVRMQHTLLGEEKFMAGMRLYFERHDGRAVTCDDFVQAMQDASGIELSQFRRWYDIPGTPVLDCSDAYDPSTLTYSLTVKQSMNPPFHIPLAVGLLDGAGKDLLAEGTRVLSLKEPVQTFVFENIAHKPVPSLLRDFSAPVILNYDYSESDLVLLIARDSDTFNRWEAGQRLATDIILRRGGKPSQAYLEACARTLAQSAQSDPAFGAEALGLPSESALAEQLDVVDPDALHAARNALRCAMALAMRKQLEQTFAMLADSAPDSHYSPDPASIGRRALRNLCLGLLLEIDAPALRRTALEQFERANNMTDKFAALGALANCDCPERIPAIEAFYQQWKDEPLVVDKWLAVQATSRLPGTLARVRELLEHPAFDIKVPNKVYALIRSFVANHVRFHAADGSGYAFLADQVIRLNELNPQVAARMARGFDRWTRFDAGRQARARRELERIRDTPALSKDVAEIVLKALG